MESVSCLLQAHLILEKTGITSRVAGAVADTLVPQDMETQFPGAEGIDPELIKALEKQFGFDRPIHERYLQMLWDYLRFELGESYYQNRPVVSLILERFPVSISLGLWSMLLTYLIAIPLGVSKAVRDGSRFDAWTSAAIFVGYATPSFLFAVLLIVLFACPVRIPKLSCNR